MGFLAQIVREVRASIDRPGYLDGLPDVPREQRPPSMVAALLRDRTAGALLVEFKRVSPGLGENRRLPTLDPETFVAVAQQASATGLSCLACEPRFEGSPRDVLALAWAQNAPVLYKDFVVDPRQIEAARRAGASAILLVARLAEDRVHPVDLAALAVLAHEQRLEVVLEFHRAQELAVAEHVAADAYAVNVRDLDTLKLRPDVAAETMRRARDRRPMLSFSGIDSPAEAAARRAAGADGILVGSALHRARDPERFLDSLRAAMRTVPA